MRLRRPKRKKRSERTLRRYHRYLEKSPRWKHKRKKILKRDRYRCRVCGSVDQIEVHHIRYTRIFHEEMRDLVALCHTCHQHVHVRGKVNGEWPIHGLRG